MGPERRPDTDFEVRDLRQRIDRKIRERLRVFPPMDLSDAAEIAFYVWMYHWKEELGAYLQQKSVEAVLELLLPELGDAERDQARDDALELWSVMYCGD